jgi:hypothetical protein
LKGSFGAILFIALKKQERFPTSSYRLSVYQFPLRNTTKNREFSHLVAKGFEGSKIRGFMLTRTIEPSAPWTL